MKTKDQPKVAAQPNSLQNQSQSPSSANINLEKHSGSIASKALSDTVISNIGNYDNKPNSGKSPASPERLKAISLEKTKIEKEKLRELEERKLMMAKATEKANRLDLLHLYDIKIVPFHNGAELPSLTFKSNVLFNVFKEQLGASINKTCKDFQVFILQQNITKNDLKMLSEVFGVDKNPHVIIKDVIKPREQVKSQMITKIEIEGFPTRNEVILLLNSFLDKRKLPREYKEDHSDKRIVISMTNSDTAYAFIKRLEKEKTINNLYSRLAISLYVDSGLKHPNQNSLSSRKDLYKSAGLNILHHSISKNPNSENAHSRERWNDKEMNHVSKY